MMVTRTSHRCHHGGSGSGSDAHSGAFRKASRAGCLSPCLGWQDASLKSDREVPTTLYLKAHCIDCGYIRSCVVVMSIFYVCRWHVVRDQIIGRATLKCRPKALTVRTEKGKYRQWNSFMSRQATRGRQYVCSWSAYLCRYPVCLTVSQKFTRVPRQWTMMHPPGGWVPSSPAGKRAGGEGLPC